MKRQLELLAEYPCAPSVVRELPLSSWSVKVVRVGQPADSPKLDQPELCKQYWNSIITRQEWYDENKEHLVVLLLSTRYNITGYSLVSIGSTNASIAHPRECFRVAVAGGAYAMVLMHNHPSGDPSPSQADHSLTRRLKEGADLLQINLLDHIIVGRDGGSLPSYFSFREAGVL
jgi:DNA repair protein RadC